MTFALEFRNADGVARLTPEDFVDRLVTSGSATLTFNAGSQQFEATITVAGMLNNNTWAVVVYGYDCRAVVQAGSFRIVSPQPYGTYRYAVYRR